MKFLLTLLVLLSFSAKGQFLQVECNNIQGTVSANNGVCTPITLNPPIPGPMPGIVHCFNFVYSGPVNLSYLIITGSCGPFPLYTTLAFTIYNSTCDTLMGQGTIVPTSSGTYIDYLPIGNYIICYTWNPKCAQTDVCPIINESLLPVQLLFYEGEYDTKVKCVTLNWATASEFNASHYVIEKSYDGINFKPVAEINAKGWSSTVSEYFLINCDFEKHNIVYFNLIQVDYNGDKNGLGTVAVELDGADEEHIEIYDIYGNKLTKLRKGVNIIKSNERYYKVFKLKDYGY